MTIILDRTTQFFSHLWGPRQVSVEALPTPTMPWWPVRAGMITQPGLCGMFDLNGVAQVWHRRNTSVFPCLPQSKCGNANPTLGNFLTKALTFSNSTCPWVSEKLTSGLTWPFQSKLWARILGTLEVGKRN